MNLIKKEDFLKKYHLTEDDIINNQIKWTILNDIYTNFNEFRSGYKSQADFIADTGQTHLYIVFISI